ncbi:hypothetical protein [Candidatus Williamhamiltonella defendens]|uniref:hypothetical protein n=1 Tax=Candidatus Williamhamiltonella defendens TaxID=138072 RepID=UPI0012FE3EC3|nr:hypothetical protein [Candidatus Hamiltonella defensa]
MRTEPEKNTSIVFFDNDKEMQKIKESLKKALNCDIKSILHTHSVSDIDNRF